MTQEYPDNALCNVEGCGHRFDAHGGQYCRLCGQNQKNGFEVPPLDHMFVPRKLAGGALTPEQELEAYNKAMGRS